MKVKWTDAQQNAISATGRSLLVSAAAGSGKTATLTEKIIRALTNNRTDADKEKRSSLSRMLIVTFTRASAADVRAKISKALTKAIANNPTDTHLYNQMVLLGSADISTIDSFCMKPVRENFADCSLPASFRIADDAELAPIRERVLKNLVDEFFIKYSAEKGDGLFDVLTENDFADLFDALSDAKSDSHFTSTVLKLYSSLLNYPEGIEILRSEARDLYNAAENRNIFLCAHGKALLTFLSDFVASALPFFTNAVSVLKNDDKGTNLYLPMFANDFETVSSLDRFITEGRPYSDFAALFSAYDSIKLKSYSNAPQNISSLKEPRTIYTKTLKEFRDDFFSTPEEELYSDIYRTARMCEVLYNFLSSYDKALSKEKRERGVVDFTDNKRMLYSLLYDKEGNLTPLAKDYSSKYDIVFIDEYQDVDEIQDKIFAAIGGDHRFMVGDIKQSIYGFRGAEPTVFSGYRKSFPELDTNGFSPHGNTIFMSENFRCNEPVIKATNAVCSHIFRACPDTIGYTAEDDLKFSKDLDYSDYDVPRVKVDIITNTTSKKDNDSADEAEEMSGQLPAEAVNLANQVAELLRGEYYVECENEDKTVRHNKRVEPSDITILVRNRNALATIKAALLAMNIPTEAAELDKAEAGQDLLNSAEMIYILNLLRVINNPANDISLLEILGKAPVCGSFELEEIVRLRAMAGENNLRGLYYTVKKYAETPDSTLAAKCRVFTAWLDGLRELTVTHSAEELLRVIKADKFCYCGDSDAFLYVYEKARTYRQSSFVSLHNFLSYFERHITTEKKSVDVSSSGGGRVSIMTFHGSKGLEFPVCFIYNCGARFGDLSVRGDLLFLRRLGASMMLFYRTGDLGEGFKKNTVLRNIAKYAITLAEREAEMQNLYVAMTRAREYLYISASPSQASMANVGFDKGDRFRTLYSSCYSAWILTGLEKASNINEFCDLEYKDAATVSPAEPLPLDYSTQTSPALDDEFCSRYRKLADMTVDATKEEKFLRSLPTKAPASKLADDMLDRYVFSCDTVPSSTDLGIQTDEDSDLPFSDSGLDYRARESVLENLRLMKSSDGSDFEHLLGENQRPTAAERGTAAHAFLQYCDLKKFISADENSDTDALVREEIARLTLLGFIEDGAGKMLDVSQLVAFFKSNFFKVVRDAVEYRRELRFNRFVPLASLTKNPAVAAVVGDRTLYVQGSIDLTLHTKDGGIILCDYKSDRITDEERASRALLASNMKRKHSAQLKQYSKAIFDLYGKYPERIYIYSLSLGEAIEIDV